MGIKKEFRENNRHLLIIKQNQEAILKAEKIDNILKKAEEFFEKVETLEQRANDVFTYNKNELQQKIIDLETEIQNIKIYIRKNK